MESLEPVDMISNMYNLADRGSVDNSTAEPLYRRYDPDVAVSNNNDNININVRDMSEYYSLSDSFLEIELEYSKAGGALVAAEGCRPCHMAGGVSSCFNTSRLRLNNVLVEDNQYSLHNSFVKVLTTKSKQWVDTIGRAQGIVLDTSEGADPELYAAAGDVNKKARAVYNEGLKQRIKLVGDNALINEETKEDYLIQDPAGSKTQTYTLPLPDLFSFCSVNKVLKGAPVRIELIKNSGALNCFTEGGTAGGEVRVKNVFLWLKLVRPSLPVLAELETMYNSETVVPWNFPKWTVYSSDSTNEANRRYTFSTLSEKPHHCFLFLEQPSDNALPPARINNLRYSAYEDAGGNPSLTQAKIRINGRQYPYTPYDLVWTSGSRSVARAYQELVKFASRDENHTDGFAITPQTFRTNYPILHFNLADVEPSSGGYQIGVELTNSAAPINKPVVIYLCVVSEASVQVQLSNRNVLVYTK